MTEIGIQFHKRQDENPLLWKVGILMPSVGQAYACLQEAKVSHIGADDVY